MSGGRGFLKEFYLDPVCETSTSMFEAGVDNEITKAVIDGAALVASSAVAEGDGYTLKDSYLSRNDSRK